MTQYIETYGGHYVDPFNLCLEDINIEAIAHSLATRPRFSGHADGCLNIAEHSVNVSMLVDDGMAKAALLHDAGEYLLPDVASPVKQNPAMAWLVDLQDEHQDLIYQRFNVPAYDYRELKQADIVMMAVEAERNLTNYATSDHWRWVRMFALYHFEMLARARQLVTGRDWQASEALFLNRWNAVK